MDDHADCEKISAECNRHDGKSGHDENHRRRRGLRPARKRFRLLNKRQLIGERDDARKSHRAGGSSSAEQAASEKTLAGAASDLTIEKQSELPELERSRSSGATTLCEPRR